MIIPMKKVSLIIMGNKREEALKKLRKSGLIHIEITEGSGERLISLKESISLLYACIFEISSKNKTSEAIEISPDEALNKAKNISVLVNEKKQLSAELLRLKAESERLVNWGEINPEEIKSLAEKGIDISLFEIPPTILEALPEQLEVLVLSKSKAAVKCVIFGLNEADFDIDFADLNSYKLALPEISTKEIKEKISLADNRLSSIDEEIKSYAVYTESFKKAIKALEKEIEFETYATGMMQESLSGDGSSQASVAYFKGYIEAEKLESLKKAAAENSWGLLAEDPTEEDDVPTKLKNNKFVSLIYPLTDFLGTVPGYFEYDISGWFLGFILIFFGIIFGDGGYGLLICAVSLIPIIKSLISKKPILPAFLLVGLFGLSTVIWGTLTCTWFGLSADVLPNWLQALSVPFISNVYADKLWQPFWVGGDIGLTTSQNLQIFCFTLALIQLTAAHIKGAVRNRKSLKSLGDIGSALQLLGIYYVVLSLVVNSQVFPLNLIIGGFPIGSTAICLVGLGFVMSFIFSNYEGSVIKSLIASLTNIVSVLLGVVNVFSDIVSYIRLWAVGLAGAAISATVNELAGPLFGNFLFMTIAIILLVFGHGLNMILNILSVIVHGIRLNTLEFSSHLDMSWSGHKFKPFEE